MTTETRSVAEIMGWTEDDAVTSWCRTPDGPTPDDMLAWLRECRPDVAIEMWYDPEHDPPCWVRRWDGETPEQGAPTLHAALEAAVRAVAGEAGE